MPKQPKPRISKKQLRIVDTATALFTRFGFKRVTVEEICRKADASKMTFYKYFPNKIELLKVIWNGWLDEGYKKLDQIDRLEIPFPEKMEKLIEFKMEMLSRWNPEFIEEIIRSNPELSELVNEMRIKNMSRFITFIEAAQDRGEIRRMRPEFILAISGKLIDLMEAEDLRSLYSSDLEFIREIHDFFFFGILQQQEQSNG